MRKCDLGIDNDSEEQPGPELSLPHPEEGRLLESTAVTLRIWAAQPPQLELPQFALP